jgi:pantoate--beta-alanine ligase
LALSSRNGYLSVESRAQAPQLYAELQILRTALLAGGANIASLEAAAMQRLSALGWLPDYISVRKRVNLLAPSAAEYAAGEPLVVVAAAKLAATRLIDNLEV